MRSKPSRITWSTAADLANCGPSSDMRMVSTLSRIEARLDRAQRQRRADEQRRADQQHQRQGDFADDQDRARLVVAEAACPIARRSPSAWHSRSGRELCSAGIRPKRMPVTHAATPIVNAKHAPVHADQRAIHADARQVGGVHAEQRADADDAEDAAERSRPTRESIDAFRQQLPDDAAATGADSGADGDLAAASDSAGQQQVGHVGAGDQQDEADGADQHQQRGADVLDHGFAQRVHAEAGICLQRASGTCGGKSSPESLRRARA